MKIIANKYCTSVLILLVILFSGYAAQAQVPEIASSLRRVDLSEINTLWFQAMDYLDNGELLEANLKLADLNQKKIAVGLDNLPAYSTVLVEKAKTLQKQGNSGETLKLLDSARLLSPDLPALYFASARLRFAQNPTNVYGIVRDIWRGLFLKYTDINTIITYVNNGFSIVIFAGVLTSAVFILFSFIYYRRAIFYQIKETFPIELPTIIAHIIGWVLVGIVALGLGIFWGFLFLAFLLIWHVEPAAKRILQVVLFFSTILAVLLLAVGITFITFDGDYFQALRDLSRGEYSSRSVVALQQRLSEQPGDTYAIFSVAYLTQKLGNIADAITVYEMMPAQYPDQAAVQNNLGNSYQQQFRMTKQQAWYQQAEQAYRNAILDAPKMFEPRYNLGQLLLLDLEFTQSENADAQLRAARNIDNQRFTMYSEHVGEKIIIVDASFSLKALVKRLYEHDSLQAGMRLVERLWENGSRFKNPWYFSIASGVILVLSFIFGAKKGTQKQGTLYCQMCGDPYTVRRKKSQTQQTFCTQCTYIFKKKTVVKPEKRTAKIKQIRLRQKLRGLLAKVSSICFPGAGQIYFGYATKGALLSFFFYLVFGFFWLKGYLRILFDADGEVSFSLITLSVLAFLIGGIYLFNLYDILKLSPKNQ